VARAELADYPTVGEQRALVPGPTEIDAERRAAVGVVAAIVPRGAAVVQVPTAVHVTAVRAALVIGDAGLAVGGTPGTGGAGAGDAGQVAALHGPGTRRACGQAAVRGHAHVGQHRVVVTDPGAAVGVAQAAQPGVLAGPGVRDHGGVRYDLGVGGRVRIPVGGRRVGKVRVNCRGVARRIQRDVLGTAGHP